MHWSLASIGAAILALTLVDFVWTVLSLRGAGPVTGRIARGLWLAFRRSRLFLGAAGPSILVATVLGWALLIWGGWFLVFSGSERAVLVTPAMHPADAWGRLYFAGFTITTLGVGDLTPGGPLWQMLTAIGALNGLVVITTGITYLLAVVSGVVGMRSMATHVRSLGHSPEAFVAGGWDGRTLTPLQDHLMSLTPQVLAIAQQQSAYPILQYFHGPTPREAASCGLALLDEALLLLAHGVAPEARLPEATLRPLRTAIAALLENATPDQLALADEAPPPPKLEPLRAAGIATVDDATFHRAVEAEARHRRLLAAMVRHHAWSWDAIRGDGAGGS